MESQGSPAWALSWADIKSILTGGTSALIVLLLSQVAAYLSGTDFSHLVYGYGGLVAAIAIVVVNLLKEAITRGADLKTTDGWLRIARSAALASTAVVVAYGNALITGGETDPLKVAIWTIIINVGRKYADDTRPTEVKE